MIYRLLPLLGKFAVPFPMIIDSLLGDPGEPSCERRRVRERKSREEFRTPYQGVTRAGTRVGVIRVKPPLKEFRAFFEMIFCLRLEFSGKFERNALRFADTGRTGGEYFIDNRSDEA